MKQVLLLLVLVVGAALAKEEGHQEVVAEPEYEAEGRLRKATRRGSGWDTGTGWGE